MNLPSLAETVVLYIIKENYGASGYRIRRIYIESTGRHLSFGTLVPMLQRFEKAGLVAKEVNAAPNRIFSNCWHLTEQGSKELNITLELMDKMLQRKSVEDSSIGLISSIPIHVSEGNEVR